MQESPARHNLVQPMTLTEKARAEVKRCRDSKDERLYKVGVVTPSVGALSTSQQYDADLADAMIKLAREYAEATARNVLLSRPRITIETPPTDTNILNAPLLWRATVGRDKDADEAVITAALKAAESGE